MIVFDWGIPVFKIYIKSICSMENKVCFVHTHKKYPELSLFNFISIALSKSYQDTHTHKSSFICTPLWGQEVERKRRWLNTTSFALYLPYLRWQAGRNTEWWTPERTSSHLNYSYWSRVSPRRLAYLIKANSSTNIKQIFAVSTRNSAKQLITLSSHASIIFDILFLPLKWTGLFCPDEEGSWSFCNNHHTESLFPKQLPKQVDKKMMFKTM